MNTTIAIVLLSAGLMLVGAVLPKPAGWGVLTLGVLALLAQTTRLLT